MSNQDNNPQCVQVDNYTNQDNNAPLPSGSQQIIYQQNYNYQQPQMGFQQPQPMYYQQPMYQQPIYQQPIYNQPIYQQPVIQPQAVYIQQGIPMQMQVIQFVQDPMALLATAKKASVKQKFEFLEVLTGCETKNEYYVSAEDNEGNKKHLFKAKENSSWCCRNCCFGSMREFDLDLKKVEYTSQGQEKKVNFAKFERPFKCTCCCCNRPEMTGKLVNTPPQPLGKVSEPCTVCDPIIKIYNGAGNQTFTITCDCCQCGYCCRNSIMGRCSEVNFDIFNGASTEGKPTGNVFKKVKGCESLVGDADFYTITFPPQTSPEDKLMLIGAVIMIDYLYYEDKDDSNGMNGRYGGGYYHHNGHRGPPIGMGPAFGPRPFGRPFGKGPRGGFHGHHHH